VRDLDELRAFLAVVRTTSVKAAAELLDVSRTTLRRRLESLEQRVGASLFWNDAAGAHPTPAAQVLMHEGQALLDAYSALMGRVRQAARGE
jgi:DNA-binding transcriptional LysR family regulator